MTFEQMLRARLEEVIINKLTPTKAISREELETMKDLEMHRFVNSLVDHLVFMVEHAKE